MMKILLCGDLSGTHKNLQYGLLNIGYKDVTLVSSGDGYKSIFGDMVLPAMNNYNIMNKLKYRLNYYNFISNIKGFNVIQFAGPYFFPFPFFPYKNLIKKLKINNGKIFLYACGSDSFYWKSLNNLRYSTYQDVIKYDLNNKFPKELQKKSLDYNKYFAESVNGIIPNLFEYKNAYSDFINLREVIPQPIFLDEVDYSEPNLEKKINVFHGLSRYGYKGTRHIEKAFKELELRYSNLANFSIEGRLPLDEYKKRLKRNTIVVDQCNSYSYGVNALYSLAMGKVVLSGAETEALQALNIKDCPVINILPSAKNIIETIENLINNKKCLKNKILCSRKFVFENHCALKIARKFLQEWQK